MSWFTYLLDSGAGRLMVHRASLELGEGQTMKQAGPRVEGSSGGPRCLDITILCPQ